jgi:hypothetical protein
MNFNQPTWDWHQQPISLTIGYAINYGESLSCKSRQLDRLGQVYDQQIVKSTELI